MNDDPAASELARLLRHARKPRALDAGTYERSRRRVAALGAMPAAAGILLWIQHAALGAVLGAVVTTSAVVIPGLIAPEKPARPEPTLARTASREGAKPTHSILPQATPVVGSTPEPVSSGTPAGRAAGTRPAGPPPSVGLGSGSSEIARPLPRPDTGEHALTREARALERARTLLASDPAAALAILGQHEAEFGRGALEPERELLAVDALVRLGRRKDAELRADTLRKLARGSLYEHRLDELLGARR